jgi:hypothetical protein
MSILNLRVETKQPPLLWKTKKWELLPKAKKRMTILFQIKIHLSKRMQRAKMMKKLKLKISNVTITA